MDHRVVRAKSRRFLTSKRGGTRPGREGRSRFLGAFGAPSASKQGTPRNWLRDPCYLSQGLAARPWVAWTRAWR
jgi:hypothetical protein